MCVEGLLARGAAEEPRTWHARADMLHEMLHAQQVIHSSRQPGTSAQQVGPAGGKASMSSRMVGRHAQQEIEATAERFPLSRARFAGSCILRPARQPPEAHRSPQRTCSHPIPTQIKKSTGSEAHHALPLANQASTGLVVGGPGGADSTGGPGGRPVLISHAERQACVGQPALSAQALHCTRRQMQSESQRYAPEVSCSLALPARTPSAVTRSTCN